MFRHIAFFNVFSFSLALCPFGFFPFLSPLTISFLRRMGWRTSLGRQRCRGRVGKLKLCFVEYFFLSISTDYSIAVVVKRKRCWYSERFCFVCFAFLCVVQGNFCEWAQTAAHHWEVQRPFYRLGSLPASSLLVTFSSLSSVSFWGKCHFCQADSSRVVPPFFIFHLKCVVR